MLKEILIKLKQLIQKKQTPLLEDQDSFLINLAF